MIIMMLGVTKKEGSRYKTRKKLYRSKPIIIAKVEMTDIATRTEYSKE